MHAVGNTVFVCWRADELHSCSKKKSCVNLNQTNSFLAQPIQQATAKHVDPTQLTRVCRPAGLWLVFVIYRLHLFNGGPNKQSSKRKYCYPILGSVCSCSEEKVLDTRVFPVWETTVNSEHIEACVWMFRSRLCVFVCVCALLPIK